MSVTHTNTITGETFTEYETVQLGTASSLSDCKTKAQNFVAFLNDFAASMNP